MVLLIEGAVLAVHRRLVLPARLAGDLRLGGGAAAVGHPDLLR